MRPSLSCNHLQVEHVLRSPSACVSVYLSYVADFCGPKCYHTGAEPMTLLFSTQQATLRRTRLVTQCSKCNPSLGRPGIRASVSNDAEGVLLALQCQDWFCLRMWTALHGTGMLSLLTMMVARHRCHIAEHHAFQSSTPMAKCWHKLASLVPIYLCWGAGAQSNTCC